MQVPLLGQIPVVQSICENADNGTPISLDATSPVAQAFLQMAARTVTETDRRNLQQEKTRIVSIRK